MFESSLHNLLTTNGNLSALLSTFQGIPAIFSDIAPQEAGENYIVFDIQQDPGDYLELDTFTIDFNIYSTSRSNEVIRNIVEQIIFILEPNSITNDPRYRNIRFYRGSGGYIKSNESEINQYNLQIYARATRKKWIDQL